jgi:hypothetical protein
MKWEIQLTGDSTDLQMLSQSFNGPDLLISEVNGQFVLSSVHFELLATADAVRNKAQEIVPAVSGTARLLLGAHQPVELGAVYEVRDQGGRNVFISPITAVRLRNESGLEEPCLLVE